MSSDTRKVADEFVNKLMSITAKGENGTLARLKMGFRKNTENQAMSHVARCLRQCEEYKQDLYIFDTAMFVAASYAICGKQVNCGNFGASMGNLKIEIDGDDTKNSGVETMFNVLVSSKNRATLKMNLEKCIRRLASEEAPVDFRRLFVDLHWFCYDSKVARQWALGFWR